jgi:hypothetical protein
MKVSDILRVKGNTLYTTTPDDSLADAVTTMAEKDIGSLVVMEHGDLVGMLTFREVIVAIVKNGGQVGGSLVRKAMDDAPVTCTAETDLDDGHVHGRLGERGERHRRYYLELAHRRSPGGLGLRVDHLDVREDLAIRVHVLPRRQRQSVYGDPFGGDLQMRAGRPARPTMEGPQQSFDHPGHGGLAVGARDVDRRVARLR